MPNASFPEYRVSAVWIAAITLIAIAIAGCTVKFSALGAQATRAMNSASNPAEVPAPDPGRRGPIRASLDALPLAFEANQGQTDPQVKYMARGSGYSVFLTSNEAVFAIRSPQHSAAGPSRTLSARPRPRTADKVQSAAIEMRLAGGNPKPEIIARNQLPGIVNYSIGNDPRSWHAGVKLYSSVSYRGVYPGVNMVFHGAQRQLEFDFVLSPGADAKAIALKFKGARKLDTDPSGNLMLVSSAGDVVLHKPVAYQQNDGKREMVEAAFQIRNGNQVALNLGAYDRGRELVIDPSLTYTTYVGGASEDEVFGIALDSSKNVYLTGESNSTTGFPGGNVPTGHGFDAFVTKLTPQGALIYTTFVGGTSYDTGFAIVADSAGAAYVAGSTASTDFHVTGGAAQTTETGLGTNCTNSKSVNNPCTDAFALKLDSAGAVQWSTFVGGQNDDHGFAIALDGAGNIWVAGDTFSSSFYPVLTATSVASSTFNHGVVSSNPLPDDGFVVEIKPDGSAPFLYATYLGGTGIDQINGIAVDPSNNVYVAGVTLSPDFPHTSGAYQTQCGSDGTCNAKNGFSYTDGFVTKLVGGNYTNSGGYSTYIGGSSDDGILALAVDASGDAYVTGQTSMDNPDTNPPVPYPTTSGAFSTTYHGSAVTNAFVTELNPSGSALVYSTLLGGSTEDFGDGIAVDEFQDAYITGETLSADFPVTSNATQPKLNGTGTGSNSDAFVSQILAGGKTLGFSTYLGGSGDENANASGAAGVIALDSSNNIWVAGSTNSSSDFPHAGSALEPSYGGNPFDGFVAEISSAAVADFNISATTPGSVPAGAAATSTVTLSPLFGYSSPVTLSCSVAGSGSPAPSCSAGNAFSTNPLTPASSGATSTLTITTSGASAFLRSRTSPYYAMWPPIVGLSLVGIRFRRRNCRQQKLLARVSVGAVIMLLAFLPACGGSSQPAGGGGQCAGCTPAGNYTVTITGTQGPLSHSTQVVLTVN